jgi:hypothetical protein
MARHCTVGVPAAPFELRVVRPATPCAPAPGATDGMVLSCGPKMHPMPVVLVRTNSG